MLSFDQGHSSCLQGLVPYKQYSYQFSWGEHKSIVGQTRTLADGRQEEMRFGCVCCSNFRESCCPAVDSIRAVDIGRLFRRSPSEATCSSELHAS